MILMFVYWDGWIPHFFAKFANSAGGWSNIRCEPLRWCLHMLKLGGGVFKCSLCQLWARPGVPSPLTAVLPMQRGHVVSPNFLPVGNRPDNSTPTLGVRVQQLKTVLSVLPIQPEGIRYVFLELLLNISSNLYINEI